MQGIPGVIVYLDDILISGGSQEENVERLQRVLSRLREVGLRLKRAKCVFLAELVDYLGFKVDAEGVHPLPEKVTRFHSCLYGHHFFLQTDHKSLLTLFNEDKLVP